MRIGIEATRTDNLVRGIDRHTNNLLRALARIDSQNEYILFTNNNSLGEGSLFPISFNIERLNRRFRMIRRRGVGTIGRFLFRDIDIFHFPNSDVWYSKFAKTIVTLHDLAPLQFPERFFNSQKAFSEYKRGLSYIKKNADRIITVSEYAKSDIAKKLDLPGERIDVVHNGIDDKFRQVEITEKDLNGLKEKFKISGAFILFVGGVEFNNNLGLVLRAFDALLKNKSFPHELVIVGDTDCDNRLSIPLREILNDIGCKKRILSTGIVSDDDLLILYNAADLLVYPSLFEGFGFPPLEAMGCGCPVICSNRCSLPEVVGDAAFLFDPENAGSLSNLMGEVLGSHKKRNELSLMGLKRASLFSWEKSAKQTLDIYQELAG